MLARRAASFHIVSVRILLAANETFSGTMLIASVGSSAVSITSTGSTPATGIEVSSQPSYHHPPPLIERSVYFAAAVA